MKTAVIWIHALCLLVITCLGTGCSGTPSVSPTPDGGTIAAPQIAVSAGTTTISAGSTITLNGAVVGTPTTTDFMIRNDGDDDLSISGVTVVGSDFSVSAAPANTVSAGTSTLFTLKFNPTAVGTKTATITIANNANGSFQYSVSATATATPLPTISVSVDGVVAQNAGTLDFGSVEVNKTLDKTLALTNHGPADLVLSGNPIITGNAFSLTTPPSGFTVAVGSTVTFVVSFKPTVVDLQTGSISIPNNTADTPNYTLNLTGTGLVKATGITVSGANGATTIAGGTLQLTATATPAGAITPAVNWTSGTPAVATVDSTGLATAVANGTTLITATATDGSGLAGTITLTVNIPFVYFVKQANGTTTASLANGTISVNSNYSASGNGFKYVAPNYYGTVSNGFISFPTAMSGDFSITAQVTITTQNKANNACGIGLGITTGYGGTDTYAYMLMRNQNNSTNGYYVNGVGTVSAGAPTVTFANGTPLQLTFSRIGTNVTFSAGAVGGTATTQTRASSVLTDGTTAYGAGAVYPVVSFNNVAATITNLVIKDASGGTVYDSATGALLTYIPASLTLSSPSVSLKKGASTSVTATASATGGAVSGVTAVAVDPTVVDVSVTNGATNSTVNLTGLKGGVTTLTVTNTGDSNASTNVKTLTVAVNDYPTSDNYGSLVLNAYPVPGVTNAYTDGELALTFDSPPTLNPGGSIKIFKFSDGTEVDSIAFSGETQTLGTTTLNVGSQLVRVNGSTVYFTPHLGKLVYGTAYYVVIPTTAITGTLNSAAFNGLSDLNTVATWSFTTRAAPTLSASNITVDGAQSSTANFRTVQGALSSLAGSLPAATAVTINVAAGTYTELLRYTGTGLGASQTITIAGPSGNSKGDNCVVQWANGNGMNGSTQTRASFYFTGANLVLQNISLKNTGVRSVVSQAETIYFAGGTGTTLAAYNSSFYSNQDTIQTSGRNWFYNCHVEGNVDFIWGTADAALFENCDLRFVNDVGAATSYGLVVARTGSTIAAGANGTVGKGYVLLNSSVNVDANVTAYFGRDAGTGAFYDQVALVNVAFSGAGTIGTGLWNTATAPLSLGDSSYVGWKSAGCSGLNIASLTTATGTSATIASQSTEYDTRDHILNRVVTVTSGAPSGYQSAATAWDLTSLATAWGAP